MKEGTAILSVKRKIATDQRAGIENCLDPEALGVSI